MRFLVMLCAFATAARGAVPAELAAALKNFRPDPPPGWSYTQTTSAEGKTTVERYDAAKASFERWRLVQQDGRVPTPDETRRYREMRSRWSRGGTAPKITDQLQLATVEIIADTPERGTYRSQIQRGESGDDTARFLRATVVVHKPTQTIESIELASTGEFSPTFAVRIAEMKTRMSYRRPEAATPVLPESVETHVRGRAFWFKSLDADMTVMYSDYVKAR
ncbi:MAG TPA: hypothetical protein VM029_05640 [Opitutaceae bacterium]|nr:hypothetical protein [Opitutaceae bacterium]